jgi:hypothetical protein
MAQVATRLYNLCMNLAAPRLNLSEDHYIAALLPGLRERPGAAVEFILRQAGDKRSFSEDQERRPRVDFKPYYGVLASEGRRCCVPDVAIFIDGLIVTFEFKLMLTQTFAATLRQIEIHRDAVLKDCGIAAQHVDLRCVLVDPHNDVPPGAVAAVAQSGVIYTGWRELANVVQLDGQDRSALEEALREWKCRARRSARQRPAARPR